MAAINQTLVRIYANLVVNGRKTVDQIPADYRAAVQEYIAANP